MSRGTIRQVNGRGFGFIEWPRGWREFSTAVSATFALKRVLKHESENRHERKNAELINNSYPGGSEMFRRHSLLATALCLFAWLYLSSIAFADTGQRTFGQATVEPAVDYSNGNEIYLLTPNKAPFPSKANPVATAPLYLPLYPMSSTVSANDLNCQPTNCDHVNVLPFPSVDYGALPGTAKACADFNGGNPCSLVKGHDHLVGVASTGGDFNVAWHVELVVFTHAAFLDGKINTRITTLSQINALTASGDAIVIDTPITFNCSITSERTYDNGTPIVIPFP